MDRNDDNNKIIREAREKVKAEQESKEEVTTEEKDKVGDENNNEQEIKNDKSQNEETNSEEVNKEKKGIKNHKKIYIGIICIFAVIGIIYFGAKRYDNLVYPNIYLYEEDMSALNKTQLDKEINTLANYINNNKVIIKIEDKKYEVLVSDIIERLDVKKVENEILSYGKDKNFLEQFGLIYLGVERSYYFDIKIDKKALKNQVDEIYKDTHIAAVEPTLQMNGDNFDVIKGRNGRSIDEAELINEIVGKVNNENIMTKTIAIEEDYKIIEPKIDYKDLETVDYKVSSATTYFGGTGYNRGLNIANAARKVDKTLLMPGEEFSYEETVSPVELSNGYYMAPVIVNGTHRNAPGGGVCQVSTTLYNAELKAGILPTERHNHSKTVSYIKKGLDATLATGIKNLRFKNPYDYPIYIHAYVVGGQITVEIWSNKSVLDGKKYTPVSFVKGNVANTYLYGYNNKGELIYKKYIDTSVYG